MDLKNIVFYYIMSFVKLFDIIYTDSETKYKYESIVNNIKVQPFLRFNKNTCDQYTIIILL